MPEPPGLDLEDLEPVPSSELPALDLESIPAPAPPGAPAAPAASAPAASAPAAETPVLDSSASAAGGLLRPAPSARPSPVEVGAAGGYGEAPGFAGVIPYALHAWTRRKALVIEIAEARNHRKSAEADVEEALSALGRAIVDRADALGGAAQAMSVDLEAARAAVARVGAQQEDAVRLDAETEERRRALRAELEVVKTELAPHQDRETRLQTRLEADEQTLMRARAKLQRAQIEARNAAADPAAPEQKRALSSADVERHAREVEVAEHAAREVSEKLAEIKRELATRLGRRAEIEKTLAGLDAEKNATKRIQMATEDDAAKRARRALAQLGRRAMTVGVAATTAPEAVARVERVDDALDRRRQREGLLRAALDSYHKPAVYQGLGLLIAAGVVVLLFVLIVIGRALF